MSVLSAVEAVPSRLFGVFTGLLQFKTGIDKKTFQLKINPEQTKTASIFREAVSLGLIKESDGKIKLNNSLLEEDSSNLLEQFRSFVEVMLFNTEKAEKSNQMHFIQALSWFLSLDPSEPINFSEAPMKLLDKTLGENSKSLGIQNKENYHNFIYWARFFGFAVMYGSKNEKLVIPDPTIAIEKKIHAIFQGNNRISIDKFFENLAKIYPVFESGQIRQEISKKLLNMQNSNVNNISATTKFALEQLENSGNILIRKATSDATGRMMGAIRVAYLELGKANVN